MVTPAAKAGLNDNPPFQYLIQLNFVCLFSGHASDFWWEICLAAVVQFWQQTVLSGIFQHGLPAILYSHSRLQFNCSCFGVDRFSQTYHSNTRSWILLLSLLNCTSFLNGQRQPRRMWVIDQPQYWLKIHYPHPPSVLLEKKFKLQLEHLNLNFRLVGASIKKHGTNMHRTIPVVKRVAGFSLWHLATGDFYQSTALTFGIGN